MKKREILFDHMGDGDLDGYRTEFENQPNLKHLGYQTGGASKIKFLDDLYMLLDNHTKNMDISFFHELPSHV